MRIEIIFPDPCSMFIQSISYSPLFPCLSIDQLSESVTTLYTTIFILSKRQFIKYLLVNTEVHNKNGLTHLG